MLSSRNEKWVLCDQYLREENGAALLILSNTLCSACDASWTAGTPPHWGGIHMKGGG